jgi:tRNA pseudouridine55 synthase
VYTARLLGYEWPVADVEIECGKGTYIRSIARDLGTALGVGGLVQTLRRTRVGPFTVEEAISLEADEPSARDKLLPMARAVVHLNRATLDEGQTSRFRHGQSITTALAIELGKRSEVAVFGPNEELLGLGVISPDSSLRPTVVLPK